MRDLALKITISLNEPDAELVGRCVRKVGLKETQEIFEDTIEVLKGSCETLAKIGAKYLLGKTPSTSDLNSIKSTNDGSRERTPGGVFMRLIVLWIQNRSGLTKKQGSLLREWIFKGNSSRQTKLARQWQRKALVKKAVSQNSPAEIKSFVERAALALNMEEIFILNALASEIGVQKAEDLVEQAKDLILTGGLPAQNEPRKKTPGGVLCALIKKLPINGQVDFKTVGRILTAGMGGREFMLDKLSVGCKVDDVVHSHMEAQGRQDEFRNKRTHSHVKWPQKVWTKKGAFEALANEPEQTRKKQRTTEKSQEEAFHNIHKKPFSHRKGGSYGREFPWLGEENFVEDLSTLLTVLDSVPASWFAFFTYPSEEAELVNYIALELKVHDRPKHVAFIERIVLRKGTTFASQIFEYHLKTGHPLQDILSKHQDISAEDFSFISQMQDIDEQRERRLDASLLSRIAAALHFQDTSILERIKEREGEKFVCEILNELRHVEKQGGMISSLSSRRKTPQAAFLTLLKERVSRESFEFFHPSPVPWAGGASQLSSDRQTGDSTLKFVIRKLETLRIPDSDWSIVRRLCLLKGVDFVKEIYARVLVVTPRIRRRALRKEFPVHKIPSAGEIFISTMLSSKKIEDPRELNYIFVDASEFQRDSGLSRGISKGLSPLPDKELLQPFTDIMKLIVTSVDKEEDEEINRVVADVVFGLGVLGIRQADIRIYQRAIEVLGQEAVVSLCTEVGRIEASGGQLTIDNTRRKIPAGVFMTLLREKLKQQELERHKWTDEEENLRGDAAREYIFNEGKRFVNNTPATDKCLPSHPPPSLFSPLNPLDCLRDMNVTEPASLHHLSSLISPVLSRLAFIPLVDPRLRTVIRSIVYTGREKLGMAERSVFALGEAAMEEILQQTDNQIKREGGKASRQRIVSALDTALRTKIRSHGSKGLERFIFDFPYEPFKRATWQPSYEHERNERPVTLIASQKGKGEGKPGKGKKREKGNKGGKGKQRKFEEPQEFLYG